MKTIIAGSRNIDDVGTVFGAIDDACFEITEIVSGGARGIDRLGEAWGHSAKLPVTRFLPDWKQHGRSAGPRRNREMAQYADALIAIWDGKSRGTANMIHEAKQCGLRVHVCRIDR